MGIVPVRVHDCRLSERCDHKGEYVIFTPYRFDSAWRCASCIMITLILRDIYRYRAQAQKLVTSSSNNERSSWMFFLEFLLTNSKPVTKMD